MGCGCAKQVNYHRGSLTPLDTPYQITAPRPLQPPVVWVLACEGEGSQIFTDQATAIAAARERGCGLTATRDHPATSALASA